MSNLFNTILTNPTMSKGILLTLGSLLVMILLQVIKRALSKRIKPENWYKTKKTINVVGYIMFILIILLVYNDRLSGITVALGVAGAGIAFALQEVITSVAGWIAIMAGGFYKTGDRVQLGGIKGDVIDQGILRTTVMELGDWVDGDLYNGRIVRIANSFVFKEPVFNYSADFPFLWDEVKIPIKFGSDYHKAREIFATCANKITGEYAQEYQARWDGLVRKYKIENASLNTVISMKITDNWVEYTVRYVVNYRQRRSIQDVLYTDILSAIEQSGGLVALASSTINITEIPTIHIMNRD